MTKERMPFSGDYEAKPTPNKGLKLGNTSNVFVKQAEQREQFEEAADEFMAQKIERNKKAFDMAQKLMAQIKDKKHPDNQTALTKEIENQLISDFVTLALDINDDETERNGMGSAMLCNLMFKIVLHQRNTINALDYTVYTLKKQLQEHEKKFESSDGDEQTNVKK